MFGWLEQMFVLPQLIPPCSPSTYHSLLFLLPFQFQLFHSLSYLFCFLLLSISLFTKINLVKNRVKWKKHCFILFSIVLICVYHSLFFSSTQKLAVPIIHENYMVNFISSYIPHIYRLNFVKLFWLHKFFWLFQYPSI